MFENLFQMNDTNQTQIHARPTAQYLFSRVRPCSGAAPLLVGKGSWNRSVAAVEDGNTQDAKQQLSRLRWLQASCKSRGERAQTRLFRGFETH
jgi:hypothetical protein